MRILAELPVAVVICEEDFPEGPWTRFQEEMDRLPTQPPLIVASSFSDPRRFAEAFSRGAADVLMKPFEEMEVLRVIPGALPQPQVTR